ncbi:hypothetical protein [Clostridium sp.]|uniref:hypothetical protein n=1 Tax=Clostridium sp. TaxID=1506 RepID=UPI001A4226B9|nr:hypothetical protein [Clostridium sp.]MBK5239686.1 hypothetical protein [Clostridium sp.]
MSVISNIAILQNAQDKKTFSKISFEEGEKFNAKIVSIDLQNGEVNLKLSDGWQFAAKLDKPLEQDNGSGMLKFVVEGFEDSKLKVRLLSDDKQVKVVEREKFTMEKVLVNDKSDILLFEKMIKHDMPLTKDNIIDIKNLVHFKEKISFNSEKEEIFIDKFLDSRNIDTSSEKANEITKTLKGFFGALKNLDIDEILLFKENNIEITKGNLESFVKLFKGESAIYNNFKDISNFLSNSDIIKNMLENIEPSLKNQNEKIEDLKPKENEKIPLNELHKDVINEVDTANKNAVSNKIHGYGKNNSLNDIINMIKKELNVQDIDRGTINNIENDIEKLTTDFIIKEQIKLKTDEIKDIVKVLIESKQNLKSESYQKVMDMFGQKFNDIKMFNSISEQYYYLDLPINIKENEYQCKLIIKDDRKKGKKIDGKNVKIATRVKTINMGTVDAYIKINNNNMNIDINCDEFWVSVFELGKEKLMKNLSTLNYRVNIDVSKKDNEFTLTNIREFFDDRSFNTIDIKV